MDIELKTLIEDQGKAFDAFKKTHTEEIAELKKHGSADPLLVERLGKIEKSLDGAVEAKTAIDNAIKAEAKAREELEAKINRLGLKGHSKESAKREAMLDTFNTELKGLAVQRQQAFTPLEMEDYEAYSSAFNTFCRKGESAMNDMERKTLSVGTDPDGGYWVPPDISGPIVKKVFETSAVRQEATTQTISTNRYEGMEDLNEAGAGYAGEQAQGSDTTTPQIGKWSIEPFWIDTEPKATQQLLDDATVDVEAWLAAKVADKIGRFENTEFVTGAAARIRGFISGYSPLADSGTGVTWGSFGYNYTGVSADWAASNKADNLLDTMALLKNAYLPNAKWFMKRATIFQVRKFKDGQGRYIWEPALTAGQPESLLGYPMVRMEDMPTIAASSYSVAFGDLRQAYCVVDRTGIRVLRDPFTSKPYVKFYTTKRTGGGALNFEALKLLKFATS